MIEVMAAWVGGESLLGHAMLGLAFLLGPVILWRGVMTRPHVSSLWRVFGAFCLFAGLCGLTHLLRIASVFVPIGRLADLAMAAAGLAAWAWAWTVYRAWPDLRERIEAARRWPDLADLRPTPQSTRADPRRLAEESRFREITEGLPLLVWTCRPDGSCDYLSPQWVQYTGVPEESHHGQAWLDSVHPEDRERTATLWRSSLAREAHYDLEYRLRSHDGTYRWFKVRGRPLYDDQGNLLKWFGSNTDIHEERRQAEALKESEERQRRALATARLGHWEWDLRTGRIEHQDASQTLYGREDDAPFETIADYLEVVHPEDRELLKWAARRTIASGSPFELDYRVVWSDGSIHWIASRGGEIRDADGQATRMVGVNLDITRKKLDEAQIRLLYETLERRVIERTAELAAANSALSQANDAALAAARGKGEFLASMSHEIRTPMNGVVGMADLLADTPLNRTQRGYVTLIQTSAEALLTLLDDILDLSKIEAGKLSLEHAPFPLKTLCDEVTQLVAVQAIGRPLEVVCRVDPQIPPRLIGDAIRIRQVLINLMGNAVKFTHQGRVSLEVSLRSRAASRVALSLAVRDTGVGIPAAKQELIFESFAQVPGTFRPRQGGTGLGLTISRKLTDLMGGRITVESTLGVGSVFRVDLELEVPEVDTQPASLRADHPPLPLPLTASRRLLLVEDNEVNRLVACEMIRKLGCEVEIAHDGAEALAMLERDRYDVVLMDVQMPVMDGLTATREFRRRESLQGRYTPIIAMTANAMRGDQEQCLNAGMDGYIAKPVRAHLLREVLERWCVDLATHLHGEPPPDDEAVFDPEVLKECCGGEPRIMAEVLDSFFRSAPENLQTILVAVEAQDPIELERHAHRFKGACQTLGAMDLVASCTDLVAMARRGDLSQSRAVSQTLQKHWDRFRPEALAYRDGLRIDFAASSLGRHA